MLGLPTNEGSGRPSEHPPYQQLRRIHSSWRVPSLRSASVVPVFTRIEANSFFSSTSLSIDAFANPIRARVKASGGENLESHFVTLTSRFSLVAPNVKD